MTTGKKKKPTKQKSYMPRSKEKYAALNVNRQVGNRKDLLDMDYIDKLEAIEDPKERHRVLDWLNRAMEEIVVTNFDHKGPKLIKSKTKRRELYRENNSRNVDLYAAEKAKNTLKSLSSIEVSSANPSTSRHYKYISDSKEGVNDVEDAMLSKIQLKRDGFLDEE